MHKSVFCFALARLFDCSSSLITQPARAFNDNETILVLDPKVIRAQIPTLEDNQKYFAAMDNSSRYLSEYYGLHVLQPVVKEEVIHDLTTLSLSIDDRGNSAYLVLSDCGNVTFHFDKQLARDGTIVDSGHNYAWFQAIDVDHLLSLLDSFHRTLQQHGLSNKYLLLNPYFDLEKRVIRRLMAPGGRVALTKDSDRSKFRSAGVDALLAVPDPVHGNPERYADILDIVQHEEFDWFGIEMYGQHMQSTIDTFLAEPEGSPEFNDAKQKLLDVSWTNFHALEPSREDNYYFRLINICRMRKIHVYGMDINLSYDLFGHGETPFGSMVRDSFWVRALPSSGRGVLFGGSAHFQSADRIQGQPSLFVQDFLAPIYRGKKLLVFPSQ